MKVSVVTLDNAAAGEIDLNESIFAVPVRSDVLQRVVRWQLAKRQRGTHKTRGVSDISGTTAKPYKQKGTGRARQGSLRSPQFRGGATIFGPVVRSHAVQLPKKVRKLGLKIALSAKQADGKLTIIQEAKCDGKTKTLAVKLKAMGLGSALFIDASEVDGGFLNAVANLPRVDALPTQGLNVYDILRHDALVLTQAAVQALEERLA
jgi:large subunit ribosomal protein L4